jgi:Flp pilus assembly protein TadD
MNLRLLKVCMLVLSLFPLLLFLPAAAAQSVIYAVNFDSAADKSYTYQVPINPGQIMLDENFQADPAKQDDTSATDKKKEEHPPIETNKRKIHLTNAINAMHDAQALRKEIQTASSDQKPALQAKMNAEYEIAIMEYQHVLQDTAIGDDNAIVALGLIGVERNGLITKEKAVEMLVQDKNMPVILKNLGLAYDGVGQYKDAITTLQQAITLRPEAGSYMQLGTDFAQIGKTVEADAICDKILSLDPTATEMQAGCYKNVAIVLINAGNLDGAVSPLQKATQLKPEDAISWKLLGDTLASRITTKKERGSACYVIPSELIEAYQKYLQLDPAGTFAAQVKEMLSGFAAYARCAQT